jgi:uncharacterized protein (DUF1330 family)
MPAYGLAQLHVSAMHSDILEYIERIQDTLTPYQGRFLVHGGRTEVLEPGWEGDVVLLEFPSMELAREWYGSPGYQDILPLRTDHITGTVLLVEGVPEGYHPRQKAEELRAGPSGAGDRAPDGAGRRPGSV